MNGSYIYDIDESPARDESTNSYEYHKFYPTQNSDLNNYSAIRIVINAKDQLYHLHEGYLEVKGKVVQEEGEADFPTKSGIALIHNALPFMFRNFTYKMNGQMIESVDYPGHVSSLLHDAIFSSSKQYEGGLQFLWYPDLDKTATGTNKGWEVRRKMLIEEPEKKGSFVIKIPLNMIYGFAEYIKVVTHVNHEFEMTRQSDHFSLFRGENVASNVETPKGKIDITSLLLWAPLVEADGEVKLNLKEAELSGKDEYVIAFRQRRGIMAEVTTGVSHWTWSFSTINYNERPQYLLVGFQKNLGEDQKSNYALFENMNVESMYCVINNQQIPYVITDADFKNLDSGTFYTDLQNFRSNYLQIDPLINECGINPLRFKNLCTIYAFDLTKHERDIRGDVVNSRLEVKFSTQTEAHIKAYACLISEKEIFLKSDGSNMVIR